MSFVDPTKIRSAFSGAMSQMYRREVPAYGTLCQLVADTNKAEVEAGAEAGSDFVQKLQDGDGFSRLSQERHGAIRLGSASELALIGRLFGVMGMYPVGYYDLSVAGIPVHSTAFRPIVPSALNQNPFRVFTSLLRLDLIADTDLREQAQTIIAGRQIFSNELIALIANAEAAGGLIAGDLSAFLAAAVQVFRWQHTALVSRQLYDNLHKSHRLIADIVSFPGPHINHLTPRTLNIDSTQAQMQAAGLNAKAVIEGPPRRNCPILLRQTSFKALTESVRFTDGTAGAHTARFGEVEQRGVALTRKGRSLYDQCLSSARADVAPAADGSNADAYIDALERAFLGFPDDWQEMDTDQLAYFYRSDTRGQPALLPVIYEDFLPVSAAGIFQSNLGDVNLGDAATSDIEATSSQTMFEDALGSAVADPFALYAEAAAGRAG